MANPNGSGKQWQAKCCTFVVLVLRTSYTKVVMGQWELDKNNIPLSKNLVKCQVSKM